MVKGREPSFGFKEGPELQVKVFPLCVKPVKFCGVSDVTGLEVLVVVLKDFVRERKIVIISSSFDPASDSFVPIAFSALSCASSFSL